MDAQHHFAGSCHCGAIRVRLVFTRSAEQTQVRACQCGFCTRQGSMTISDPAGHAEIEIAADCYVPYQFATGSATSVICGRCGVYAGAILTEGTQSWSIANARGLGMTEFQDRRGDPMEYEHESAAERVARRKLRWTPTEIRIGDAVNFAALRPAAVGGGDGT